MIFNSVSFVLFFPCVVLAAYAVKEKYWKAALVAASYIYYMAQTPAYAMLLLASTVSTYFSGLMIGRLREKRHKRFVLFIAVLINIGLLVFFKYSGFLLEMLRLPSHFDILLPVGISFYSFQAVGYIADVYMERTGPEESFLDYALFVSFFPQLLSGPIGRAGRLLPQFRKRPPLSYARMRHGMLRMLWGYFVKLVIASRLAITVDLIYGSYSDVSGYQLMLGTFAYALEIYCDFSSYSDIAIGSAEVLGIKLDENFRQPFFSRSLRELWKRWHMSLNSWFTDYLYIPLGGGRCAAWRKYLNILIVFTVSGFWHGADWTFAAWGFLSGLLQLMGSVLMPLRKAVGRLMPFRNRFISLLHGAFQIAATFVLFCVSLVFFKADSMEQALEVWKRLLFSFEPSSILSTSLFSLGLGVRNMLLLLFSLGLLFIWDLIKEKGKDTAALILRQKWYIRWAVYYLLVILILLSANIGAQQFIYFAF